MPSTNVRVVVRFRPENAREKSESVPFTFNQEYCNENQTVQLSSDSSMIPKRSFNFDYCFGPTTQQLDFYEICAKPVVDDVLRGYNGTIFAYGQTGSGKSFSMMGVLGDDELKGVIPRASEAIFFDIKNAPENLEFRISVSYLEIYNEKIQCLFDTSKKNLKVHESPTRGIYVEGLTEYYVSNSQEIYDYLDLGNANRVVASTNMNAVSSRSHSVFIIKVHQTDSETGSVKTGTLNLVDLAGSEKVGKTGAKGQTLEEAKKINQSLSALGQCINSLVEKSSHVPFRNSKLTRILQQSLGGNSKTTMICTCSPSPFNSEETISTIKFGQRAKTIKCKVRVNQVKSAKELQKIVDNLRAQIAKLKKTNSKYKQMISELRAEKGLPPLPQSDDESNLEQTLDYDEEREEKDFSLTFAELQLEYEKLKAKYEDDISQLKEDLLDANEIAEGKKKQYEELNVAHEELEIALEDLLNDIDTLEAEKSALKKKFEFERGEIDLELEELLNTVDEFESKNKDLEEQLKGAPIQKNVDDESDTFKDLSQLLSDPKERGKVIAEMEQLREVSSQQQKDLDNFGDQISSLESKVASLKVMNSELSSKNTHLVQENENERAQNKLDVKKLKENIKSVKKEAEDLKRSMVEMEGEQQKLIKRNEQLQKKTSTYLKELNETKKSLAEAQATILELKPKAITELSRDEDYMIEEYKQSLNEVQRVSHRQDSVQKEKITSLEIEIADLTKEIYILRHSKPVQSNQRLVDDSLEGVLRDKITLLKSKVKDMESAMEEKDNDLTSVKTKLAIAEKQASSKDREKLETKESLSKRIENLTKENERLTIDREVMKQHLEVASGKGKGGNFGVLINELFELRIKYKKTDEERSKLLEEANHQRKVIRSERNKLKNASKRSDHQLDRIKELNDELLRSRAKEDTIKQLRKQLRTQKEDYESKIANLTKALETQQHLKKSNIVA